jgi:hypothetical protein
LDSRLVTDEIARLLSRIKWIRFIRFACDTTPAVEPLLKALEKLNKHGVKNYRIFVYVLVKDVEDANNRCKILKRLGVNPFVQVYRDFDGNSPPTDKQKRFAWLSKVKYYPKLPNIYIDNHTFEYPTL